MVSGVTLREQCVFFLFELTELFHKLCLHCSKCRLQIFWIDHFMSLFEVSHRGRVRQCLCKSLTNTVSFCSNAKTSFSMYRAVHPLSWSIVFSAVMSTSCAVLSAAFPVTLAVSAVERRAFCCSGLFLLFPDMQQSISGPTLWTATRLYAARDWSTCSPLCSVRNRTDGNLKLFPFFYP